MKKKLIATLLAAVVALSLMSVSALAVDPDVQISAGAATAMTDAGTVQIPVSIDTNPGLVVGRVNVTWDEDVLALTGITYGTGLGQDNGSPDDDLEAEGIQIDNDGSYLVSFGDYTPGDYPGADWTETGLLFTLNFEIMNPVAGSYTIGLSGNSDNFLNNAIEEKSVDFTDGSVTLIAPISSAALSIDQPVKDAVPDTSAATEDTGYTVGSVTWTPADAEFQAGTVYTAQVTLTAKPGYAFAAGTAATVNGQTAVVTGSGSTVTVSYAFPATAAKLSQTIETAVDSINAKYGDAAINLNAAAQTELSYSVTGDAVTVSDAGVVTINKVGEAAITISAEETGDYLAATKVIEVVVGKGDQTITVNNSINVAYGAAAMTLPAATTNGAGAISYAVTTGDDVIEIVDGKINFLKVGQATITVTAAGTANYNEATADIAVTVTTAAQTITVNNTMTATYGDAAKNLGAAAQGALSYEVTAGADVVSVDDAGNVTFLKGGTSTITITAAATAQYAEATASVTVTVAKAQQVITATPAGITVELLDGEIAAPVVTTNGNGAITHSITNGEDVINYILAEGKIYLLKVGEAEITYTAAETDQYEAATLVVPIEVTNAANEIFGCPETLELQLSLTSAPVYELNGITATSGEVYFALKAGQPEDVLEIVDGRIQYKKVGTVEIEAVAGGGSTGFEQVTKIITVTVKPCDMSELMTPGSAMGYATKTSSTAAETQTMPDPFNSSENVTITITMYADAELTQPLGDYGFADVAPGTVKPIYLSYQFSGDNFKDFVVEGQITVVAMGDVNADGRVSTADAMILYRYLAGWAGYEDRIKCMDAANIDGVGTIGTEDAVRLARHLAGWKGYEEL